MSISKNPIRVFDGVNNDSPPCSSQGSSDCAAAAAAELPPRDLVWFHAVNSIAKVDQLVDTLCRLVKQRAASVSNPIPIAIEMDIHSVDLRRRYAENPSAIPLETRYRYFCNSFSKCCDGFVPVTRHDAVPVSKGSSPPSLVGELTLRDLLTELRNKLIHHNNLRHTFVLHVVKLDTKSPKALVATYREIDKLHLLEALFPGLHKSRVWYNADVLRGPIPAPLPEPESSHDGGDGEGEEAYRYLDQLSSADAFTVWAYDEMIEWLVRIGHQCKRGLSLGWTTRPDVHDVYTDDDALRMRQLLLDMGGGTIPMLTFPVRYSLVFPPALSLPPCANAVGDGVDHPVTDTSTANQEPVQAMRQLILAASTNGCASCVFLTFWRGRVETITDDDVTRMYEYFPTATVDRD